jgi:dimethylargininase
LGFQIVTNESAPRHCLFFFDGRLYSKYFINVKGIEGLLHLKSGIAYLGDNNLVAIDPGANRMNSKVYNIIHVSPEENYAANACELMYYVLLPEVFPIMEKTIGKTRVSGSHAEYV